MSEHYSVYEPQNGLFEKTKPLPNSISESVLAPAQPSSAKV